MAKSKRGLGRGLEALMPELPDLLDDRPAQGEEIRYVSPEKIEPNPAQPRMHFDEEALAELTASIKEKGVLSPLLVTALKDGYQLVSGERRLRAAKNAGLETVPVVVRDFEADTIAELALIENIQRSDLSAYEEALGYDRLMKEYQKSAAEVAKAVGKSRPHIANMVRLLKLPEPILDYLAQGLLSAGHGRALLRLDDEEMMLSLAEEAIATAQSVRGLEQFIQDILTPLPEEEALSVKVRSHQRTTSRWQPTARQLSEKLQTNVRINGDNKKATLQIEFYGDEDLMRILDELGIELK